MLTAKRLGGLAAVLGVALTATLAACGDSGNALGPNQGGVQFVLSSPASATLAGAQASPGASMDGCWGDCHDGDHPMLQAANVTFSSILARNLSGVLVNVTMDLPTTVDVVALRDSNNVTLPAGILPPDTYDQIVVVMTEVQVVTPDSTVITVNPPGGGWTAIVPVCRFDVVDGETTQVGLKFDAFRSFTWRTGGYRFQPGFSCDAAPSDGTGTSDGTGEGGGG